VPAILAHRHDTPYIIKRDRKENREREKEKGRKRRNRKLSSPHTEPTHTNNIHPTRNRGREGKHVVGLQRVGTISVGESQKSLTEGSAPEQAAITT
jgi:hypothetical protein